MALSMTSAHNVVRITIRGQHGQSVKCKMGVVVQQMVPAQSAGVLFTRHPVTGDPRQILITANYGLGESVVSAHVEPDTILLNRGTGNKITIKEIVCGKKAHKTTMTGRVSTRTKWVVVNLQNCAERQLALVDDAENTEKQLCHFIEVGPVTQICITEEQALLLGQLGLRVETAFGTPRDIEWAISQEMIYLLQARPITSLDAWSDFDLLHEMDSPKTCDREVLSTANVGFVVSLLITIILALAGLVRRSDRSRSNFQWQYSNYIVCFFGLD
uniref:Pyruvate phosphate dikinase AMP/ATP-binding domain-containing protein n=1 Tax=Timema bartmani TaxID=61472 RepID=A0A7R9I3I0_9NEOP|nr:unnamed protein product [Timema bartmani]